METKDIEKVREIMSEVFQERKENLDVVKFHSPARAFAVAGIDLVYNYMTEVMGLIESQS